MLVVLVVRISGSEHILVSEANLDARTHLRMQARTHTHTHACTRAHTHTDWASALDASQPNTFELTGLTIATPTVLTFWTLATLKF